MLIFSTNSFILCDGFPQLRKRWQVFLLVNLNIRREQQQQQ